MRSSSSSSLSRNYFGRALGALLLLSFCTLSTFRPAGAHSLPEGSEHRTHSLLSAQNLSNEGEASVTPSVSLETIMEKALTAYGGISNLRSAYNNCELAGEIKFGGSQGRIFAYKHVGKNGQWRTDVESNVDSTNPNGVDVKITAFDGYRVWQSGGEGATYLSKEQSKLLEQDDDRRPFLLSLWKQPKYKFQFDGESEFHKVPAWSITISKLDETPCTLFLDKNNFMVLGITYTVSSNDRTVKGERVFSEYRPALGTVWPFRTAENLDGELAYEIALANAAAADSTGIDFFAKPGMKQNLRLTQAVTVPFDYSQKEIVCKARIDGSEELNLLFDTGSSDTIIDRRLAAQLFLSRGNDFKISTFGGDVSTQVTKIKRLEVGSLIINDVSAKVLDLSNQSRQLGKNIACVIGMNIIGNFLVTIDYSKPSLTFADLLSSQPLQQSSVPFSHISAPVVKATLAGNDTQEFLMDTGAAFNHIPTAVANRHLGRDGTAKHIVEGTGLDGRPVQLGTLAIDQVMIDSLPVHRVAFTYPIGSQAQQSPLSNRLGQGDTKLDSSENVGILGNPFWQNFVVTIDSQLLRIYLKPNPIVAIKNQIESALAFGDSQLITKRELRGAETAYQRALMLADSAREPRYQALAQGRLGNLRRIMAHDLKRPEHTQVAYNYFSKADEIARKADLKDVQGRVLADWSLLYSDNGQMMLAKQTIDKAMLLAPQDPNVNVDCAVHFFRARQYPEMQRYIDKVLFLDPDNWQGLWYQVKLSEMFNDLAKEKETLAEITKFYPWSKVASDKLKTVTVTLQLLKSTSAPAPP
jgi:hypothetical protein